MEALLLSQRIVASIIENFQTNDGIIIPRILVPYTGFKLID
jgi:Seryl-tRNA synthetase